LAPKALPTVFVSVTPDYEQHLSLVEDLISQRGMKLNVYHSKSVNESFLDRFINACEYSVLHKVPVCVIDVDGTRAEIKECLLMFDRHAFGSFSTKKSVITWWNVSPSA